MQLGKILADQIQKPVDEVNRDLAGLKSLEVRVLQSPLDEGSRMLEITINGVVVYTPPGHLKPGQSVKIEWDDTPKIKIVLRGQTGS